MVCLFTLQFIVILFPIETYDSKLLNESNDSLIAQDVTTHPLSKVTIVGSDSNSYVDDFSYIAAIPTSVFAYEGEQYLSPLIFSSTSNSESWLLNDWVEYLSEDDGITSTVAIGDLQESYLNDLRNKLGSKIWPRIDGSTSSENAAMLAVNDWSSSDVAILALSKDQFSENTITTGSFEYTFSNAQVLQSTTNFTVSDSNPTDFKFTPPSESYWLEGSVDWDGTDVFTHVLRTPDGYPVDYSVYRQVVFERNPLYVSELVPLNFWYPKTSDGEWTMTLTPRVAITSPVELTALVKFHPGFQTAITVPSNAKWLNVTVNWDNAGTNLNLALVDPSNRLTQWAPAESLIAGIGRDTIQIPYPQSGQWKLIVTWPGASQETNNVDVNWSVETLPINIAGYFESAANGAVIASLMNVPLLYVNPAAVPTITSWALDYLNVSNIVLVDPDDIHQSSLESQIDAITTRMNLDTYPAVSGFISLLANTSLGIDDQNVVISTPLGGGSEFLPVAAYTAAKQGGTVLSIAGADNSVATRAEETWYPYLIGPDIENIYVTKRWTTRTENGWYDERISNRFSMEAAADVFSNFLDNRGAYNPLKQQDVTLFSPTDLIKVSFDRALQGEFSVGRLIADNAPLMSIFACKAVLHRFLFSSANNADTALVSMYAYTDGYYYLDNFGRTKYIKQYDTSLTALQGSGFDIESHVGKNAVYSTLASQVSLWSFSTHGTLTEQPTDPPARPNGIGYFSLRSEDAPYGFEVSLSVRESPSDSDSIVNPVQYPDEFAYHILGNTEELDSQIQNIGSPIVILTACLLGGTELPLVLMKHGAVGVIASPRTVYFQPGGLLCQLMTDSLTAGNSTGVSLTNGLMASSSNYVGYVDDSGADYGNQQVLFGDPTVHLFEPSSAPHIPAVDPLSANFDTHTPGNGVQNIAALGASHNLPLILTNLGVEYDYYSHSNYSDFEILLKLRRAIMIYPESDAALLSDVEAEIGSLKQFVQDGGVFAIIGITEELNWLPWEYTYDPSSTGSDVTFVESQHPLLTTPNAVTDSLSYEGCFSTQALNFTTLASDGSDAVLISSSYGNGKVVLSTIYPAGAQENLLIENIANWFNIPSLSLLDVELSEYIIWAGDRLTVTLTIADDGGSRISGLSPEVRLNDTAFTVTDLGNGLYQLLVTEEWTTNNPGRIALYVDAQSDGYDPLHVVIPNLMFIRGSPLLIIVIAVAVLVIIAAGGIIRRLRGRNKHGRTKEEYKRRTDKDSELDARELFGI